jgi:hypothetical protein
MAPGRYPAERGITMIKDVSSSAAALYDGGWRAEDRDQLIKEYDLTAEEADEICKALEGFEAEKN